MVGHVFVTKKTKGPKFHPQPQSPHKPASSGPHLWSLLPKVRWETQTRESADAGGIGGGGTLLSLHSRQQRDLVSNKVEVKD